MERLKNIDIIKQIFLFAIIIFHMFSMAYLGTFQDNLVYACIFNHTRNAYLAADGFFIISGFLLIKNFNKNISVVSFIKKNILKFFPLIFIVIATYYLFYLFKIGNFAFKENILSLFFINFSNVSENCGHLWFISVYFWCSIFYFLIKKFFKKTIFIYLVIIVSSAILINCFELNNLLRGMLCFAIGASIFHIKQIKFNFKILNSFLFLIILYLLFFCKHSVNYFAFILFFSLFFYLSLKKENMIFKFNFNIQTFTIYVIHIPVLTFYKTIIWKICPNIVNYPLINLILIILTIYFVGIFLTKHFQQKILSKFYS